LKVAATVGYWSAGPPENAEEIIRLADDLGFDSVWTAEAYGSDALTPLAWWGASTSTVRLGTGICQMSARPPTTLAMAAMTLDHLSGGRVVIGIGASNPQVVEGWYGTPFPRPLERTREYISIMRQVIAREAPVRFEGRHYQLPLQAGTGLGKPLKSTLHPYRKDIPIVLAAEGPKNIALAAEIADGWMPMFFSPSTNEFYAKALAEGFAAEDARCTAENFEVLGGPIAIVVDNDVEGAADLLRPLLALYIGGMGARGVNFHQDVFVRMGYEELCIRIQDLYLSGDRDAAAKLVPTSLVEEVALIGPLAKIRDEIPAWKDTIITTFVLSMMQPEYLEAVADLVRS
jgi:F420-dependent oxidoreductase-like protein